MGYGVTPRPYPLFSSICWLFSFLVFRLTSGKCRIENSATSSTAPQDRPAWIAFPHLLCNIFLVACANLSFLMLVSLCKHLKRGKTGFRVNCLPNVLEEELQRNPWLWTDSSLPSTTFPSESYTTGSPSSKYEHRHCQEPILLALLRNIQNIRICMKKKPIVSVTYENERISIKTANLT